MNERLIQARIMAEKAHEGQTDKAGKPYILHPEAVAAQVKTEEEKIVALLHDTVEDTELTIEEIRERFGSDIAEAVDAMTHKDNETYEEYVDRLSKNPIARKVKLADLTHNMDLSRIPNPTERDFKRIEKYKRAYAKLKVLEQ